MATSFAPGPGGADSPLQGSVLPCGPSGNEGLTPLMTSASRHKDGLSSCELALAEGVGEPVFDLLRWVLGALDRATARLPRNVHPPGGVNNDASS
eukprot:10972155-Alexandrium_andersonii.AAC.1